MEPNGTILLQGRRDMTDNGIGVFLNGLKIALPQTVIGKIELVGGNIRLTVETPDSSKAHAVEKTDNLSAISWGPVGGVTTTVLSPTSLQLEFAQPVAGMQFYRVTRAP
jgi:hypothetical protein